MTSKGVAVLLQMKLPLMSVYLISMPLFGGGGWFWFSMLRLKTKVSSVPDRTLLLSSTHNPFTVTFVKIISLSFTWS